jgi:hypothetical protein
LGTLGEPFSAHRYKDIGGRLSQATLAQRAGSRRDLRIPILREPLVIEHGMAQVAHSTATGVDWNEQAVERYAS